MTSTTIKGLLLGAIALGGLALPAQAMCVTPSDPTNAYEVDSYNLCITSALQELQSDVRRLQAELDEVRSAAHGGVY